MRFAQSLHKSRNSLNCNFENVSHGHNVISVVNWETELCVVLVLTFAYFGWDHGGFKNKTHMWPMQKSLTQCEYYSLNTLAIQNNMLFIRFYFWMQSHCVLRAIDGFVQWFCNPWVFLPGARHHIWVKSFVIFYGHKCLIAFGSFTHNYKKLVVCLK